MTTHFHVDPSCRMSKAVPILPLYARVEWTGTTVAVCHFNETHNSQETC